MDLTGIKPVTSCLQSARESGYLRVTFGSLQAFGAISEAAAGLCGSNPGG
jgi:hypothetical protein